MVERDQKASVIGRAGRLTVQLLLLLAATGCVARPDGTETLRVESRSYGFIGEMLNGGAGHPVTVDASLTLPDRSTASPPYPALVLLHSSNGQGSQDWLYAKRLSQAGIAVLAVNSFSARDVSHTVRDQTLVSTASMLFDAFAALRLLQADPRIDAERIGVMGFSKGGIAALYAVYESVRSRAAAASEHFVLHIAYYPWCGLRLADMSTTGAPVLIQSGALDDLVPPQRCAELITASEVPPEGQPIRQVVHPDAQHAFDHPLLAMFGRIPITAPSPANCKLAQQPDGSFRETHSGTKVTAENLKAALAPCSLPGHAGGNEAADDRAWRNTVAFLRAGGLLAANP